MAKGQVFELEVQGLDVLKRKLNPANFLQPVRQNMIREAAEAGNKRAQKAAKPHSGDKGGLARAIQLRYEQGGLSAIIDVESGVSGIAFVIEEGRRPGRRPPRKATKDWMQRHGIDTSRESVDAMRKSWMEQGTKGIHFMAQAAEHADNVLKQRVSPTEQAIERKWNA